jgi:hypothetical protein
LFKNKEWLFKNDKNIRSENTLNPIPVKKPAGGAST